MTAVGTPDADARNALATSGTRIVHSRSKRTIDVIGASVGLIFFSPLLLLMALVLVIESGWPPLYAQTRAGLHGEVFRMWKFRSMIRNAETLKAELMHLNEAPYPAFKIANDPRITHVGRWLRKTSVDELPQLWNVVCGEMSLVGPRPLPIEESLQLRGRQLERLSVRPGITCLWQLSDRHASGDSFETWLEYDLQYIREWSPVADLKLILKTVPAVLKLSGR